MRTMDINVAIRHAYRLYETWVSGDKKVNLDRIQASIRQEIAFNKQHPQRCTEGCKRATRADAILLGKVRKSYQINWPEHSA